MTTSLRKTGQEAKNVVGVTVMRLSNTFSWIVLMRE